jgi:hypothetical protein
VSPGIRLEVPGTRHVPSILFPWSAVQARVALSGLWRSYCMFPGARVRRQPDCCDGSEAGIYMDGWETDFHGMHPEQIERLALSE